MDVSEYFCHNTKTILYSPSWVKECAINRYHVSFTLLAVTEFESITPETVTKEQQNRILTELMQVEPRTLCDNTELIAALRLIESVYGGISGKWYIIKDLISHRLQRSKDRSFLLASHRSELERLYKLFVCYQVLVWEETNVHQKAMQDIIEMAKREKKAIEISPYDACCSYLSSHANKYTAPEHRFEVKNGQLLEFIKARSLYDALVYQILLHIAAGKAGLDGCSLAECVTCGKAYKKKHGNQKFCPICSRNSERVRAYKQRKKEAQSHAPHP